MSLRAIRAVLLVVPAFPGVLRAQRHPVDSTRQRLDTVVVSATREPRSLTRVPFAVSVVSADQWAGRSGYGLDQALSQLPGVVALSRYGTQDIRLTIRGFGARGAGDRSNAATSRGVRVLLDGIPETEPDGRTSFDQVDLASIARIEVLRSNGSAAYGNAAGGIVSLSSMPEFTTRFAELTQQTGSFGLSRTTVRGGAAIGAAKTWGAVTRTTFGGWRGHSDASRTTLIGGALAPLSGGGQLGVQLAAASNLFRLPGPLTPAQYAADPQQANATYASRDERRYNRLMRLGLTFDQPIGEHQDVSAMLFVNPKLLQRSERNTFRDFTRIHSGGSLGWGTRATVAGLTHRVRVGGDFAFQDGAIQFYTLATGNTRGTLTTNKAEGAQNAGLYVQDEVAVREGLTLLVGARYDDIAYFYRDYVTPSLNDRRRFTQLTPRVGLSWLVGGSTVYASYGAGVEAPAGNEVDPPATGLSTPATAISPLLDAIRSHTVEAGIRRYRSVETAGVRGVTVDAALYRTRVEGEPVPYNGGRFYLTAGEVTRQGLEFSLAADLVGGLTARVSGTLSRNVYDTYRLDSTYLGAPGKSVVLDGNRVAGLPGRVLNASLGWRPASAPWLGVEVGAQQFGDYFADDRNSVDVPGFTTFRAAATAEHTLAGGLVARASLAVENLTNATFVGSAFVNPDYSAGQPLAYESGLPRALVVGLTFRRAR